MKLFLTILILLLLLFSPTGCSNDESTSYFQHMQIAEPLAISPNLDSLVSMTVIDINRTGSRNNRRLSVVIENNTGVWLSSNSIADYLEFFDGEFWRTVSMIAPRPQDTHSFPPNPGEQFVGPFTLLLYPSFYGFDGTDGPGLADFWPGLFRLRHRVWADGEYGRISHEIVAEFTLE